GIGSFRVGLTLTFFVLRCAYIILKRSEKVKVKESQTHWHKQNYLDLDHDFLAKSHGFMRFSQYFMIPEHICTRKSRRAGFPILSGL
ncbi:MAG: hypothetical protein J6Q17_02640, partial [Clostridia bacterium]|nr:hypothetical protein [Clostridia bacterium]